MTRSFRPQLSAEEKQLVGPHQLTRAKPVTLDSGEVVEVPAGTVVIAEQQFRRKLRSLRKITYLDGAQRRSGEIKTKSKTALQPLATVPPAIEAAGLFDDPDQMRLCATLASIRAWAEAGPARERQARQVLLTRIDASGRIAGDLVLVDQPLSSLPTALTCDGSVMIERCPQLVQIPAGLRVRGDFYVVNCTGLTGIAAGVHVDGEFSVSGHTALRQIAAGLRVGRNFCLRGCTALSALPAGLQVGGNLDLGDCIGLPELPVEMKVGGHLYLRGCRGLSPQLVGWLRDYGSSTWAATQVLWIDLSDIGLPHDQLRELEQQNRQLKLVY